MKKWTTSPVRSREEFVTDQVFDKVPEILCRTVTERKGSAIKRELIASDMDTGVSQIIVRALFITSE